MSRRPIYEVFLSFRGEDTRRTFADHLYHRLTDAGIRVFRDEEELRRGETILPSLIQAVKQSKISIPIISKGYGSSKSCLIELDQIWKCNESQIIIPIFYYVDPSDVRNCRGRFKRSYCGHKRRGDGSIIDPLKIVLNQIGKLKGYHLHENSEVSHEGELVKKIVCQVQQMLKKEDLLVTKQLVGVDHHMSGIMAKLDIDYNNGEVKKFDDTCIKVLGIYGMAGIGKTELAKYVYNQLCHLFDACSFLKEIRTEIEHRGLLSLQNKLISDLYNGNYQEIKCSDKALIHIQNMFRTMKILLLLDDVKDDDQLSKIVGELDWLGPGSRVILTSQRHDVLRDINGPESFVLGLMKQDEALNLFCRHAFRMDSPCKKFVNLSRDIVAAIGGLPLALVNVGKSLRGPKSKSVWEETLTALEDAPARRVEAAFEKSCSNLDENGKDKRIPYNMGDALRYFPSTSMALHARSLVEIGEDKELRMHKPLGRDIVIVKNECPDIPFGRSRMCDHEDEGTWNIKALALELGDGSRGRTISECNHFDLLEDLRFLKLDPVDICGNFLNLLSI